MKKLFLSDTFIFIVIFLNAFVIFLEESNVVSPILDILDIVCSIIFLIEMVVKHIELGFKAYWSDGWNKLDGILVILSIPSILMYFLPLEMVDMSVLLTLRLLRILRVFRVMHFFPDFAKIVNGFKLAMSQSYAVLLSFFVIIVIFGLINCSLFRDYAPEYFGDPLRSIFSVFQMFTIEGWYDIPNAVADGSGSQMLGHIISVYFCLLLILGGIIGMSFINSVFVDAMVSDNNDDVKEELDELRKKLDEIKNLIEQK